VGPRRGGTAWFSLEGGGIGRSSAEPPATGTAGSADPTSSTSRLHGSSFQVRPWFSRVVFPQEGSDRRVRGRIDRRIGLEHPRLSGFVDGRPRRRGRRSGPAQRGTARPAPDHLLEAKPVLGGKTGSSRRPAGEATLVRRGRSIAEQGPPGTSISWARRGAQGGSTMISDLIRAAQRRGAWDCAGARISQRSGAWASERPWPRSEGGNASRTDPDQQPRGSRPGQYRPRGTTGPRGDFVRNANTQQAAARGPTRPA